MSRRPGHHPAVATARETSGPVALAALEIAAFLPEGEASDHLVRQIQRCRAQVRRFWPMPEQLPVDYDALVCDLVPDLPRRLPWLPGSPAAALIVVLLPQARLDLTLLHSAAPHAVIHLPATDDAVTAALSLGRGNFLYERRLRGRIDKLDDTLRTLRSVERAKAILIETKNISESDAYNFLRKRAMERRVPIGTLAAMIVDSHELLG